jgi:hypothetical protein
VITPDPGAADTNDDGQWDRTATDTDYNGTADAWGADPTNPYASA